MTAGPADQMDGRRFAACPEAAAILERDVRSVRKAALDGRIPAQTFDGKIMIPVAWIRDQVSGGVPAAPAASALTEEQIDRIADRVAARIAAMFAGLASREGP